MVICEGWSHLEENWRDGWTIINVDVFWEGKWISFKKED